MGFGSLVKFDDFHPNKKNVNKTKQTKINFQTSFQVCKKKHLVSAHRRYIKTHNFNFITLHTEHNNF